MPKQQTNKRCSMLAILVHYLTNTISNLKTMIAATSFLVGIFSLADSVKTKLAVVNTNSALVMKWFSGAISKIQEDGSKMISKETLHRAFSPIQQLLDSMVCLLVLK